MSENPVCMKCGQSLVGKPTVSHNYGGQPLVSCSDCANALYLEAVATAKAKSEELKELEAGKVSKVDEVLHALGLKSQREMDKARGLKGINLPGITELPTKRPKRTLADAFSHVRGMVDANTQEDWETLYSGFEAGELEKFNPGPYAPAADIEEFKFRVRAVASAYKRKADLRKPDVQAQEIEKIWTNYQEKNGVKVPGCGHIVSLDTALSDLAWFATRPTGAKAQVLCRSCGGRYITDPVFIKSIQARLPKPIEKGKQKP